LYYRIRVVHLQLPPLMQRREDIPLLVDHMLAKFNHLQGKDIAGVSSDAMARLMEHDFPGNVRELENIIERAVILEKDTTIHAESLPQTIKLFEVDTISPNRVRTIDELNREYAEKILDFVDHNRSKAAELLGISRTSLWRILKK
jgi:DNA-binding NtrC family response regulator